MINIIKEEEIKFNSNIAEISSISIESEFTLDGNVLDGNFIVNGSYKTHALSLNKEEFNYSIPFTYTINEYFKEDSVNIEIKDFNYNIDSNKLYLTINYNVLYTKDDEYFYERKELDNYLNEHEVEVIDFNDDNVKQDDIKEEIKEERIEEKTIEKKDENKLEIESIPEDDEYVTYEVYICSITDTFESIAKKYNVTTKVLHEYNDEVENIQDQTKLIIPLYHE